MSRDGSKAKAQRQHARRMPSAITARPCWRVLSMAASFYISSPLPARRGCAHIPAPRWKSECGTPGAHRATPGCWRLQRRGWPEAGRHALAQVGATPGGSQVGAHSIHQEVMGIRTLAIHTELARPVKIGRRQHHSRRRMDEGAKAPAFQGHVFHKPVANERAHRGVRGVEQRRAPQNGNTVTFAANRQGKVQTRSLVNFNHHTTYVDCLKAVSLYC